MPTSVRPVSSQGISLVVLDALRGMAALYVMLGHGRWLLWSGYSDFADSGSHGLSLVIAVLASSLRYGHQAVLLFFLISGFVIHYRQASGIARGADGQLDLGGFAWRRLRRLSPPLVL